MCEVEHNLDRILTARRATRIICFAFLCAEGNRAKRINREMQLNSIESDVPSSNNIQMR